VDRKIGRYTPFRIADPRFDSDVISIIEDHSGVLWVGTFGHGLVRFDPKTGRGKTYHHNPADPYSLSNDIVPRLLLDHQGNLWAATWDGLDRFDASTERFTAYRRDPQVKDMELELVEGPDGALWLGTDAVGLQRFDPATGHFTSYESDVNRASTLSDNRVNSIHFTRSGVMWVGTQNGLDKFDPKTSTFTVYNKRDGLPGNAVSCILEDQPGNLWFSTNNGLARFNPQTNTSTNFSAADGLPGADLTGWGACFKNSAGEMFFGGYTGLTAFFPDKVVDSAYSPPIVLTDFRLFGTPVALTAGSPLKQPINYARTITLSSKQSIFSIEFSALSYFNSAMNRYRYELEGLDQKWNEVGSDQRTARYTTLPVGTYTFRVQGATSTGRWTEPGAELRIEILPPWWGTWWFRVACAVCLLLMARSAYRYRLEQVAQRFHARLEERTRIARELHDTLLQSIQGLMLRFQTVSEMLPARPLEAKKALEGALERADKAVVEGRDAIKDMRTSTLVDHDLAQSMTALMTDLHEELATGDQDSVAFRVLVEGNPRTVHPTLRDEIYRIARESLRNAFRHAQARHIETEITYSEPLLRLRFRDDGRGIDPRVLEHGGRSGHWGFPGMRERANHIGAQLDVWSKPGAGTEVELSIPGSIAYEEFPARPGIRFFRRRKERNHEN
jgi:signal transduction histidine kinase